MFRSFAKRLLAPRVVYIGGRGATLIISFVFSILYSRLLGLENRSVLTFIFTVVSLLVLGFTASLGLSLRERISRTSQHSEELLDYFKKLSKLTFILLSVFNLSMILYSNFVVNLPIKIYAMASLLLVSSSFVQGMNECLVALGKFRTVMFFEISQVSIQILAFLVLERFSVFSYINAVMFSITCTYFLSGITILLLIRNAGMLKHQKSPTFVQPSFLDYFRDSIKVILPTVLIDRIDKLLIAGFLPLSFLSKYSILLTFISLSRFIPESVSKMYFSTHRIDFHRLKLRLVPLLVFGAISVGLSYFVYHSLTLLLLGRTWLLPFDIFGLVAIYELVRAIYVISINRHYAIGSFSSVKIRNATYTLVFLSVILPLILLKVFGLRGVPLGLTFAYLIILLKSKLLLKNSYNS